MVEIWDVYDRTFNRIEGIRLIREELLPESIPFGGRYHGQAQEWNLSAYAKSPRKILGWIKSHF